jgi:hypothetical protein
MSVAHKKLIWRGILTSVCILFLSGSSAFGQAQLYSFNRKVVNWGFKVGLNANAVMHLNGERGEEELINMSFRNKSGCDISGFFRVNLDRFFLQPEVGWSTLNKEITFSFPSEEVSPPVIELQFRTQTVSANGLIGYNITKTGPFVFNVLTGTSFRYKFNTHYSITAPKSHHKDANPMYNAYGVVGFSMNISNVHFDIRYAISMLTTNMHFDNISDKPDWMENVVINKTENLLSFSCGVMF